MITTVGALSAASFLLMFLEIRTPFSEFLKYDPSDLAALVAGFTLGPVPGALVVVLRNLLRALLVKPDPIGLAMNTVAGATFVLVASTWYQRRLTRGAAAAGLALGALAQTIVCVPAALIALPLYGMPWEATPAFVASAIVPFNLLKTSVTAVATFLLYKRVAPYLPRYRGGLFQAPRAARPEGEAAS